MNVLVSMGFLIGHDFFRSSYLLVFMRDRVLLILAMEELIKVMNGRNDIEVVFLRWAACHPLQSTCIPRVKRSTFFAAGRFDDVHNEEENTKRQNERAN